MQKVALYVRVSTQEQAQEGYSIAAQTERLQAYCAAKDWIIAGTYVDAGFSGSNMQRPELIRLLGDVRAGIIDCVLVYKLDRLSRSQKDTLTLIEDEFLSRGVSFVSLSENFDTNTPLGRAMVGILSVFAQLEREQIRERMAMGKAQRAKEGLYHGGHCPFGYTYIDGLLQVEPLEAEIVKEIYDLFLGSMPINKIEEHIATRYGRRIKRSIVRSVLSLPLYHGVIVANGEEFPGQHEAIIDDETWNRAQMLLHDRRRIAESKPKPFAPAHLLSGLLVCGECGSTYICNGNYHGHGATKRYVSRYVCSARVKKRRDKSLEITCRNPSYACQALDERIINEVLQVAGNQDLFSSIISRETPAPKISDSAKAASMRRLDDIDTQIRRVLDMYQLGAVSMDEIKRRMEALETEKKALQNTLEEESAPAPMRMSPRDASTMLAAFENIVKNGTSAEIRDALFSLIEQVAIEPENGKLDICWRF